MNENGESARKELSGAEYEAAVGEAEDILCGDASSMTAEEAEKTLHRLEELYSVLAACEPEDEDSDEAMDWEALLEDMDDMMDDLRDRLDEV